ncbi:signal peptidase I [Devosia sp. Leaf64]|uniref:signal peptidase I n=1 Tax=Devosia sp. Leaf64 TaxID=1736229 RepID=UPI0007155709|nr:signal peptidase I [Devosia sp. Leaf64]KQN69960.1 hypothetical protein ASE94_12790 [Devosia sp. Leaf64]
MRHSLALTIALCTLATPALAAPFYTVPSSSMMPTLGEGDTFLAIPYAADKQRGDIIVFSMGTEVHVSRIIGVPGDTVTVIGGIVFLDRTPLAQTQLATPIEAGCPDLSPPAKKCAFYREALPEGSSHVIISTATDAHFDNTQAQNVGEGQYFVLSDNRDNAVDSRFFGPIDESAILGIVHNLTFSPRPGSRTDRLEGFPDAK